MPHNWEIWLDVHFSSIIAKWLNEHSGIKVKSSYILDLKALDDKSIFLKAKEQGNVILISKDTDFPDLISQLGPPPKRIYVKKGNCDNKEMWTFIKSHIDEALKLLIDFDKYIIELE